MKSAMLWLDLTRNDLSRFNLTCCGLGLHKLSIFPFTIVNFVRNFELPNSVSWARTFLQMDVQRSLWQWIQWCHYMTCLLSKNCTEFKLANANLIILLTFKILFWDNKKRRVKESSQRINILVNVNVFFCIHNIHITFSPHCLIIKLMEVKSTRSPTFQSILHRSKSLSNPHSPGKSPRSHNK